MKNITLEMTNRKMSYKESRYKFVYNYMATSLQLYGY